MTHLPLRSRDLVRFIPSIKAATNDSVGMVGGLSFVLRTVCVAPPLTLRDDMKLRARSLATIAITSLAICDAGCAGRTKDASEFDSLLRNVSYDTSDHSVAQASSQAEMIPQAAGGASLDQKKKMIGQGMMDNVVPAVRAVGNGLKATAGFVFVGLFKVVNSAFEDDDEPDLSTARGRADENFNRWLDSRDRWRRE